VPGEYRVELSHLAASAGLSQEQVRRALAALHDEGHIDYEPPFSSRGVEKIVADPPPFDEVAIDWERQAFLRGLEEEKLDAMEAYVRAGKCRRAFILDYFGETNDLRCGVCDRCRKSDRAKGKGGVPAADERDAVARFPQVAIPVLVCVKQSTVPLGPTGIGRIVTGSRDKRLLSWGGDSNPAYGTCKAKRVAIKVVIDALLDEGYLTEESYEDRGGFNRRVLALTSKGRRAADAADLDALCGETPDTSRRTRRRDVARPVSPGRAETVGVAQPPPASAPAAPADGAGVAQPPSAGTEVVGVAQPPPAGTEVVGVAQPPSAGTAADRARATLDELIDVLLTAERGKVPPLLDALRLFRPGEIVKRLIARYDASADVRVRSRATWAAGELCGEEGLGFLIRCAASDDSNVRRLAASAMGKVLAEVLDRSKGGGDLFDRACDALATLASDKTPQVRQYASKALKAVGK
jgi:hypothetical protein